MTSGVLYSPPMSGQVMERDMAKPTLRELRIRRLMSARRLGEASGVAASTILAIEEGQKPQLGTIDKLSKALGVDAFDISWPGNPLGVRDAEGEE